MNPGWRHRRAGASVAPSSGPCGEQGQCAGCLAECPVCSLLDSTGSTELDLTERRLQPRGDVTCSGPHGQGPLAPLLTLPGAGDLTRNLFVARAVADVHFTFEKSPLLCITLVGVLCGLRAPKVPRATGAGTEPCPGVSEAPPIGDGGLTRGDGSLLWQISANKQLQLSYTHPTGGGSLSPAVTPSSSRQPGSRGRPTSEPGESPPPPHLPQVHLTTLFPQ